MSTVITDDKFYKGENLIIPRTFLQSDGTEITYANISSLTIEFIQNGETRATLVKTDDAVQNTSGNQVDITLTRANSGDLVSGHPLNIKYTLEISNTDFDQDSDTQKAIILEEHIKGVVL